MVVDAEPGGHPPGVLDVADRAAARVAGTAPQLHGGAHDVVALLDQQRGRDRGVHTPERPTSTRIAVNCRRSGAGDPETSRAPLHSGRRRSTAFGKACSAGSTSPAVVAWPRERRRCAVRLRGA